MLPLAGASASLRFPQIWTIVDHIRSCSYKYLLLTGSNYDSRSRIVNRLVEVYAYLEKPLYNVPTVVVYGPLYYVNFVLIGTVYF